MKIKYLILVLLVLAVGCKEIETSLHVESGKKLYIETDQGFRSFEAGDYPIVLELTRDRDEPTILKIKDLEAELYLPTQNELLHILEPRRILAEDVGQPFDVLISREVGLKEDDLGISLYSSKTGSFIAVAQFKNKPTEVAYDERTGEFLRSYQKVRSSQRAVFIPINGDLDSMVDAPDAVDDLINFTAMLLLAPWVRLSYAESTFLLGDKTDNQAKVHSAWRNLIKKYPVVDYIPFTHGGTDSYLAMPLLTLPKKEHQLRFVYSEGCSGGSAYQFIKDYNAATTIGHDKTSMSPLFAFSVVRAWTTGSSAKDSMKRGWKSGRVNAYLANLLSLGYIKEIGGWDNIDKMVKESELMIAWTEELTPDEIFINRSAVVSRTSRFNQVIWESRVTEPDYPSFASRL